MDEKTTVFFPFYPILMKAVSSLTGLSYKMSGQIISTICFFVCLTLIQTISEKPGILRFKNTDTRKAGRWIACITAFNPVAFYYTIPYTESLFFMLTLIFMLFINKRRWFLAGVTGMIAGVTRNSGVLLIIIFVLEYIGSILPENREIGFVKRCKENLRSFFIWIKTTVRSDPQKLLPRSFLYVLLIPSGFISYFVYLYVISGTFGGPSNGQRFFGRVTFFPIKTIVEGISHNINRIFNSYKPYIFYYYFLELIFVLFFLFSIFYLIDKIPFSYYLFMLVSLLLPLIKPVYGNYIDYFGSFPRYTITLFPYFAALFGIVRKSGAALIFLLAALACLLILSVSYFCKGLFIA
jgi:hypothetical protein